MILYRVCVPIRDGLCGSEMALDVLHDRLDEEESHWVFAGNRIRELDPAFPVEPLGISRQESWNAATRRIRQVTGQNSRLQENTDLMKKAAGAIFIAIGAAAIAASFFLSGTLFVVVGVSLIMDVRIWRS